MLPDHVFLFDLDNTLYSRHLGVVARVDRRINDYMAVRLGIPADEVDALRRRFWLEHGTTLRGLTATRRVDPDDYLRYVHDVDLSDVLAPDPELRRILRGLPGRSAVFSNASRSHATNVLERIGIIDCFDRVIALEDLDYVPKPAPEAYATTLAALGARAADCSFVEDTLKNLAPAKELGMRTFWVSDEASPAGHADVTIARVHDLERVLAEAPR